MSKRPKFSEGLLDNETILNELNIGRGQTIIDAGCGNGYMAKQFSKLVGDTGRVYALDSDSVLIDILKKEVEGSNIIALAGDITKPTTLQASSIDLIYLSTVFHIFSRTQLEGFVKEAKRLLKAGAVLAIVNIKKEDTPFGPPVEMRSSPEELINKVALPPKRLVDAGNYFYMQLFGKIKCSFPENSSGFLIGPGN